MKFSRKALAAAVTLSLSGWGISAQADESLAVIEVTKPLPLRLHTEQIDPEGLISAPSSDSAQSLLSVTGVSGSRMGGRGIDPVIRGQSQTQLNVLLDGAFLHGGCPNRMDPPTTYASMDSYDRVTLIKGHRSVQYGSGGSGGTLLFERERPVFDADKPWRGRISAAYIGNSDTRQGDLDLAGGGEQGYLRLISDYADAGNYRDGDGRRVRSSFENQSNALLAGVRLGADTWLDASYEQKRESDVLFPGARMDSPYSDADSWRVKLEHSADMGIADRVRAEVYRTEVSHLMDNYSLRTPPLMNGQPSRMKAPTTSDTAGGRLVFDTYLGGTELVWGVDTQKNEKSGRRIQLTPMGEQVRGVLWPDVSIRQTGVFVEGTHLLDSANLLKGGLRYDRVRADADASAEAFTVGMGMDAVTHTPVSLYGQTDIRQTENNLSGFLTWRHQLNDTYHLETHLSRSVRSADATERYMAAPNWIGTPDLSPEKHHQLEWVLGAEQGPLSWSLSAYYNHVDDYILRQQVGNASRYRNVQAAIYGSEFELDWRFHDNWRLSQGLSYTRGKNRSDGTDLSQITPLSASLALRYQRDRFEAAAQLQAAAKQTRVCEQSSCGGQDVRKTPGYEVLNLNAAYHLTPSLTLSAGVDNLFDRTYALHQSRGSVSDPSVVQVNEPGRTAWLRASARF